MDGWMGNGWNGWGVEWVEWMDGMNGMAYRTGVCTHSTEHCSLPSSGSNEWKVCLRGAGMGVGMYTSYGMCITYCLYLDGDLEIWRFGD